LSNVLQAGDLIKTRHCQSYNWISNIILGIDEECIDIGIEKEYIDNIVMVGDTMSCKYTTSDSEYMLVGWITNIKPDFPQKLTIKIHNIYSYSNKRESYRYDVYLCSVIKKDVSDKKGMFAIMTNISLTGAAFTTREELSEDFGDVDIEEKLLYYDVFVSNILQISFVGKIKRKIQTSRGVEYGVKIEKIKYKDEENLYKYINTLENLDKEYYVSKQNFWNKNSKLNKGEDNDKSNI
jgi:hypothetical protein